MRSGGSSVWMWGRFGVVLMVALAASVVAGCGNDDAGETSSPVAEELVCDPARPFDAGEYDRLNALNELEQPYWVVVPVSYSGTEPLPLLVILPGGAGDRDLALAGYGPDPWDGHGIVVIPELPMGPERSVAMIESLLDEVTAEFCVDPSQVGVLGGSSSGLLTGKVASAASDRVAAVVAGLGRFLPEEGATPLPILAWTGDTDRGSTRFSADQWAEVNGCDPDPTVTNLGSGISHLRYEDCEAPVEFYDITGMGHQVPARECPPTTPMLAGVCAEYEEFDLLDAAAAFMAANPLR